MILLAYPDRIQALQGSALPDAHLHFACYLPVLLATALLRSALNNHTLWGTAIVRSL